MLSGLHTLPHSLLTSDTVPLQRRNLRLREVKKFVLNHIAFKRLVHVSLTPQPLSIVLC